MLFKKDNTLVSLNCIHTFDYNCYLFEFILFKDNPCFYHICLNTGKLVKYIFKAVWEPCVCQRQRRRESEDEQHGREEEEELLEGRRRHGRRSDGFMELLT